MTIEITAFMANASGSRARSFSLYGFNVRVEASENDAAQAEFTSALASALGDLETAKREVSELSARVPANRPQQLFGPGYVRERDGQMWLLGKREPGWAAWGIRVNDWDELFRRFNVRVSKVATDEHGSYVEVVPGKVSK